MNHKRVLALLAAAFIIAATCSAVLAEDQVDLKLTFPNGRSPKVFTVGWTFGAKAILNPGTKAAKDISKQVKWSGSGTFSPSTGPLSHPSFSGEGANTINLSVSVGGKKFTEKFTVQAVKPHHATVGFTASCTADSHGCPACPHPVAGRITTGNPKVKINGKAVACVGDGGVHDIRPCCGPNTFKIVAGDPNVLVDGKPVARIGDKTQHCGGVGQVGDKAVPPPPPTATTYRGTFSGGASGKATFTIKGSSIQGTFTGGHLTEGGGSVNVKLKGTYDGTAILLTMRRTKDTPTGNVERGTLTGTATYVGLNDKPATAKVTGAFKGITKYGGTFKGMWVVVAHGLVDKKVIGSFSTTLVKK